MKHAICIIGLCGLASPAISQNYSLTLVPSVSTLDTFGGGQLTIDVYGDADVGTHLSQGYFGLQANSPFITDVAWTPAEWSVINDTDGYAGNGNHSPIIFGQIIIPGVLNPSPGSYLGQRIGTFVVRTVEFNGVLDFDLVEQDPFTLQVYDDATGTFFTNSNSNLFLQGFSINAGIPAPSCVSVILVSGLLGLRRKR